MEAAGQKRLYTDLRGHGLKSVSKGKKTYTFTRYDPCLHENDVAINTNGFLQ